MRTEYLRPFADEGTVYIEAKDENITDSPITVQNLLAQDALHKALPHDFQLPDGVGAEDGAATGGPAKDDMRLLWDHLALSRTFATSLNVEGPPERLANANERPLFSAVRIGHAIGDSLSQADLLDLAATAHPNTYPSWWSAAKRDLINAGTPDALVARSARPRKRRRGGAPAGADGTEGGGLGGGEGAIGSGGTPGASGGDGRTASGSQDGTGTSGGREAGATGDAREPGSHRGGQDGPCDAISVNRSCASATTARPHIPADHDPSGESHCRTRC